MKPKQKNSKKRFLATASYSLLLVLLVLLLWTQHLHLRSAWAYLVRANSYYVVGGMAAMAVSLGLSATMYVILSPKRLSWRRTVLVQAAGMFVNKLLPAGSGALGVNYLYLRKQKINRASVVAIVALNNMLGTIGHLLVFAAIWVVLRQDVRLPTGVSLPSVLPIWVVFLILALVVGLCIVYRAQLAGFVTSIRQVVTPRRIGPALGCSMLITMCYWLCLLTACHSVGLNISLFVAFMTLTASVFASSILPTPGGIGAAEAGVYAALVAYGVPQSQALASAVLYRVITFWIPLLVGSVAFVTAGRRRLIV